MSQSTTVADSIIELAGLVRAGDRAEAKRQARALLDTADPHHLTIVAQCASILDYWPRIGVAKLRVYWQSCIDPQDRAIIEACAPEPGEHPQRTQPDTDRAPRANAGTKHQARSTVRRRQTRPELRSRRDQRQQREEPAIVTAYHQDRAGVDDAPQHGERPDGYAIDYDRAAVPALYGTPCVCCWLERSAADQNTSRRSDDGLCSDCREKGRPGIPELPARHTAFDAFFDAVTARCAVIAAKYHPDTARAILRNEWNRAHTEMHRDTIAEWVEANRAIVDAPAEPTRTQAPASCDTCGGTRQVRDGHCIDCRTLDAQPVAAPGSAIDPEADDAAQAYAAGLTAA